MGGTSTAGVSRTGASIFGYAAQNWVDGSAYGSRFAMNVVANNATASTERFSVEQDGRIAFGTPTSSGVSVKPSGTTLKVRLGDDSADGPITASTITASTSVLTPSLTIGSGTAITKVLSATATLDFGSILAAASADLTITVTGAAVGDSVSFGLPAAPDTSTVFNAFVSSTNTVTVRCFNVGTIAVDPASATYRVTVHHF